MRKLRVSNRLVRLISYLILTVTVLSLISQTYYVVAALNWPLLLSHPQGYAALFTFWFYGLDSSPILVLDPAWPNLIIVLACLMLLRKQSNS